MGHFGPAKGSPETHTLALILLVQSRHQKASGSCSAKIGIHKPRRSCGERSDRLAGVCSPPRLPGLAQAAARLPAAGLWQTAASFWLPSGPKAWNR